MPFALWFETNAAGQHTLKRYDVLSPRGQEMLRIYAKAVEVMKYRTSEDDPRSWMFQWYTHYVRGDREMGGELARVFPAEGPRKELAMQMWNTCHAHSHDQDQRSFLPWHRMYVYFFERIVRKVSGKPTFTLPYWNYSVSGPTHGVLPAPFRSGDDAAFRSLFVAKRRLADPVRRFVDRPTPKPPK